ncbi:hypothetical protein HN698_00140 [Candidatus Woesearchaeota archaeon]|jgi:hypothetical protein|nr:hypothetical protein [Candidatus Woesearchaeota archaeon]MBT4698171.1 hypothetical protein [Candidatus Woesearchaeota archaeon]MBT4716348.1 hypothetical protein [Candidatus Woesearchaeota archaeon]MBT7930310.1 hypothetical protein [Candidatus Woesearchaeota archaeon]
MSSDGNLGDVVNVTLVNAEVLAAQQVHKALTADGNNGRYRFTFGNTQLTTPETLLARADILIVQGDYTNGQTPALIGAARETPVIVMSYEGRDARTVAYDQGAKGYIDLIRRQDPLDVVEDVLASGEDTEHFFYKMRKSRQERPS